MNAFSMIAACAAHGAEPLKLDSSPCARCGGPYHLTLWIESSWLPDDRTKFCPTCAVQREAGL